MVRWDITNQCTTIKWEDTNNLIKITHSHSTYTEVDHIMVRWWEDILLPQLIGIWDIDKLHTEDLLVIIMETISMDIIIDISLWLSKRQCMMRRTILLKERLLQLRNKIIRSSVKQKRDMRLGLKLWEMMKLNKMISMRNLNLDLSTESITERTCIRGRLSMDIGECNTNLT